MKHADGPTAATRRPQRRQSFSQRNLALETEGPLGALLGEALAVPQDESGYQLTHVFHPYPGRFHPALPRTLLSAFFAPGGPGGGGRQVLDPFMGGGTTLVEAQRLGLTARGNDLNPVALLVARERTRQRTAAQANQLEAQARRIAVEVEGLRNARNAPRLQHPTPQKLVPHYLPHLLAELMQWLRLIEAVPAGDLRESLRAVFSSAVVKFSNLASDSQVQAGAAPRYPKGAVSRFLVGKTLELAQAQVQLTAEIPTGTPEPVLTQEDARLLPSLPWGACDVVLTSPPYPGTYDYHAQHRLRMDWLQMEDAPFREGEIGARRHEGPAGGATVREGWSESLRAVLGTMARVLAPGGSLLLVMGDWIANEHAVDAATMLGRTAAATDWTLSSRASVQREVHSRVEARAFVKRGKWEHLLHFTRPDAVIPPEPPPAVVTQEPAAPVARKPSGATRRKPQASPEERALKREHKRQRDYERTPRARRERAAQGRPEPAPLARSGPVRPSSRGVIRPGRAEARPETVPAQAEGPAVPPAEPDATQAPESVPTGQTSRATRTGRRIRPDASTSRRRR